MFLQMRIVKSAFTYNIATRGARLSFAERAGGLIKCRKRTQT